MNIRQRITLLIVLTFIALSLIGGFAVFQSRESASEVRTVTEGVVPSAIKSVELLTQLKDVQIATLAMIGAPDMDAVARAKEQLALRKTELQKTLAAQQAQASSEAQHGLVRQAEESLLNYFGSIDDTANFMLAGQKTLAEATLAATVNQYLREQGSVLETLQIEKRRSKDEAIATMNKNLGQTATTLLLATLVAVFGLSVSGVLLYRQIIHPIGEMQSKMTEIATSQDFSQRLPVKRMDEIGRSVTAFNLMIEKIQESSELIRQKTADIHAMLHYIPQGILTLEAGNRVHPEYSDYLKTILETEDIAGRDVMDLVFAGTALGADARAQIEAALGACIGEDALNLEFNAHLLVKEIEKTMPDGRVKVLDLSWSPITDAHDTIVRLMLCVRDVTELKALARAADAQKRELAIIGEILAVRQDKFQQFMAGAGRFADENERLLHEAGAQPDAATRRDTIAALFRNMHTIKGNARTYGLSLLTDVVHQAEQSYDELRQHSERPWDGARLLAELQQVRASLREYIHIHEAKLGRAAAGAQGNPDELTIARPRLQALVQLLADADARDPAALARAARQAHEQLAALGAALVRDLLADVHESLPALAQALQKPAPHCTIRDNGIRLRPQLRDLLQNVCTHLYRNAMDHGIEAPAQRLAAGKPAAGRIELALDLDARHLSLRLSDDGRGLAIERIRRRAVEQGLLAAGSALPPGQIAQLIFQPGFSTAEQVTEISGRGVGMDAVRGFVEDAGGRIELALAAEASDSGHYPFETVITLPAEHAVHAAQ